MKHFLRLLCLLLALSLTATAALGEATLVTTETAGAEEDVSYYLQSLFVHGGVLWGSGYSSLYRYDDTARPTELHIETTEADSMASLERVVSDGETLYGYFSDGSLRVLTLEDSVARAGTAVCQLDQEPDEWRSCFGLTWLDGKAYLLVSTVPQVWGLNELWQLDPATGACTLLTTDHLLALCAYKDGLLLAEYWDQDTAYNQDPPVQPTLGTFDPASAAFTTLCEVGISNSNMSGLAYDLASDAIYMSSVSGVFRIGLDSTAARVAYIAMSYISDGSSALVVDGAYCLPDERSDGGVLRASTDPSKLPARALRLSQTWMDDTMLAFTKAHPEVPLELVDSSSYNAKSISQSMVSGSDALDVYTLSLNYSGFTSLRDKGYCMDLSTSQVLLDSVQAMYPQFTTGLLTDGHLWAYPRSMNCGTIAYSPAVLEKLGLTTDDLPTTWDEMIDFCVDFVNDYSDIDPDVVLTQGIYDIRQQLFYMILESYINTFVARGETVNYNTPLLQGLLTHLEQAAPTLSTLNPDSDGSAVISYSYSSDDDPTELFNFSFDLTPSYRWNSFEPLPLGIEAGAAPAYSMYMDLYIVNPNTTVGDLAITFLEYMAENGDDRLRIVLNPDQNDPVEDANMAKMIAEAQGELDALTASLTDTSEEDRRNVQDSIDSMTSYLSYLEKDRWSVSPEDIALWRSVVDNVVCSPDASIFSSLTQDGSALLSRYMDGQLDTASFLQQFDRIIRMVQMENE